jgi:hypothetical protein
MRTLIWLLFACSAAAQAPDPKEEERRAYILANYTKYEHRIPMRDGARLFTAVYMPKDDTQKYPILLMRTPYSVRPYGADNYSGSIFARTHEKFVREGFIFALQDVRGRMKSEGQFVDMRPQAPAQRGPKDIDESTDTYARTSTPINPGALCARTPADMPGAR